MHRSAAVLAVAGTALCLAGLPAAALEDVSLYGMTLAMPSAAEGWSRQDKSDNTILQITLPVDPAAGRHRPGAAMIQIVKPVVAGSDAFPEAFAKFVTGFAALARERPITKGTGVTVNGHAFAFERRCCGRMKGVGVDAVFVGVASPRGYHFLQLVTLGLSREDENAVEAVFEAIVRSFRPGSGDRAFALAPAKDGGGLEGAYTTLNTGLRPNVFGGLDFYADNALMLFEPSGLYSREFPKAGATLAEHCRATPTDCGTYRLTGSGFISGPSRIELSEVENQFGMLKREEKPLTRKSDALVIAKAEYKRLAPLPKGTPFEGTWRYFFAQSGTGAVTSGGVAVERMLSFTRDGRFRRTGSAGFSSSTDTGGGTTGVAGSSRRPLEQGRYLAEGHALTLTGEDGRSERLSLFAPEQGSDKLLVIDGNNYLKQDGAKR